MTSYDTNLSNLSYTNKDFAQIYPELLDLTKKISYKWDPSLSDESDPGVVLLKLAAIIADKCNYNIDKNILELFPTSVTQLANARQLFDQCGYTMRHYRSATTSLKLRMFNEPELTDDDAVELTGDSSKKANDIANLVRIYTIPKFTMFTNEDNDVVYTILEDVSLDSNGSPESVAAIEGTHVKLEINGTYDITSEMLDSENRVYFSTVNVPENGIFVTSIDDNNSWRIVDNLLIHPLASRIYKFGLTPDGSRCYIEFPTDIQHIIGKGLNISYVVSSGLAGNVAPRNIKKFFNETSCSRRLEKHSVSKNLMLNSEHVYITNDVAVVNGQDPETIEDAYRNYQKVKNTFNTLVSTKDYSNFFQTSGTLSNCFVCDRSDDIQSSYKILEILDGVEQQTPVHTQGDKTVAVKLSSGEDATATMKTDEMTAFDLRVYGLEYVDSITSDRDFARSFNVVNMDSPEVALASAKEIKTIAHDYLPFKEDCIIMLKNKYPICAKIVSAQTLNGIQAEDVLKNVKLALFNLLNSKKLAFGEAIDYTSVYNTILKADSRISAVALEDIKYETYAIYLSSRTIKSLRIDSRSRAPIDVAEKELYDKFRAEIYAKSVLAGNTPLLVPDNTFSHSLSHMCLTDKPSYQVNKISTSVTIDAESTSDITGSTVDFITPELKENECITLTSPNLVNHKTYSTYVQFITNIGLNDKTNPRSAYKTGLRSQDEIVVRANEDYVLGTDEYIIFFWRSGEDENAPYSYVKYTGRNSDTPTVICPSYNMYAQPHSDNISSSYVEINDDFFRTLGDVGDKYSDGQTLTVNCMYKYLRSTAENSMDTYQSTDLNILIAKYIVGEQFNVKTNQIEVKKVNTIHLNNNVAGAKKFYWILNQIDKNGDKSVYRLFDENQTSYTLKQGEQFIYTDLESTTFYVLGSGTLLERKSVGDTPSFGIWEVPALRNTVEYLAEGPKYFENPDHQWFGSSDASSSQLGSNNLYATEMLYKKLTKGTKLGIHIDCSLSTTSFSSATVSLKSDGVHLILDDAESVAFSALERSRLSYTLYDTLGNAELLPYRNHEALAWDVAVSCNIDMSSSKPQRLYENQRLSWEDTTGVTDFIDGSDYKEIYIQSDYPLTIDGGDNLDVRVYSVESDELKPLQLYIYQVRPDEYLPQEGELTWSFNNSTVIGRGEDIQLTNIFLPQGTYILPLKVDSLQTGNAVSVKLNTMRTLANSLSFFDSTEHSPLTKELWEKSNAPSQLSDVATWFYGQYNIDTTRVFKTYTIEDVFGMLFQYSGEETVEYPKLRAEGELSGDALEFYKMIGKEGEFFHGKLDAGQDEIPGSPTCTKFLEDSGLTMVSGDILCLHTVDMNYIWIHDGNGPALIQDAPQNRYFFEADGIGSFKDHFDGNVDTPNITADSYAFILRPKNLSTCDEPEINSSLCPLTNLELDRNQTYYFVIDISEQSVYTLHLTSGSEDTTYTIPRIRKVTYPKLTPDTESSLKEIDCASSSTKLFDHVVDTIKALDVTRQFDISREVPPADLVSYPLESSSFLDASHPFNRCTISQWIVDSSIDGRNLVVLSRAR